MVLQEKQRTPVLKGLFRKENRSFFKKKGNRLKTGIIEQKMRLQGEIQEKINIYGYKSYS